MTITLRAVGLELTSAIHEYVEEKFGTLEKYAQRITLIDVALSKETNHHNKGKIFCCSVTVQMPGDVLKIEREEEDLYAAIDQVKDHLRETLAQKKERDMDHRQSDTAA